MDEDPNLPVLLDNMDATGTWAATAELRAWERGQLQLVAGERLLDVGCGHGDAGLDLAADLGADGELVAIDASAAMVGSARARRASSARGRPTFDGRRRSSRSAARTRASLGARSA